MRIQLLDSTEPGAGQRSPDTPGRFNTSWVEYSGQLSVTDYTSNMFVLTDILEASAANLELEWKDNNDEWQPLVTTPITGGVQVGFANGDADADGITGFSAAGYVATTQFRMRANAFAEGALTWTSNLILGQDASQDGEIIRTNTGSINVDAADSDNDGLTENDEVARGTDPQVAATDNDGLNDGTENTKGTNPLNADTDNDGLNDGTEVFGFRLKIGKKNVLVRTNPTSADTDRDGILDGVEAKGFKIKVGKKTKVVKTNPVAADTDKDGFKDLVEKKAKTDPTLKSSKPKKRR